LGVVALVSHREQSRIRYRFTAFELLLLLFLALGFAGFVRTYLTVRDFGDALTQFKRWATPPIFFFLLRALLAERRDIARLIKVMAWTTVMAAVLTWWDAIEKGPRSSIEASRVSGIFNGPNEMGTFLVYSSMMMLAVVVWRTSAGKRMLYLGGFLLAARAMLFTFSRGAYVSLAIGSALILLLRNPFYLVGAGTLGAAAVALNPGLLPDSVVTRLAQTTRETAGGGDLEEANLDKSVSHRFVLWRAARLMIEDHPLAGVGLGRFAYHLDGYVERPLKEHEAKDVHNAYLLVATELGIPALLVMIAILVSFFVTCLKLYFGRRHGFDRMVALGAVGSVVALACTLMLGSRFADENYIGYFWTLAAFIMVLRHFRDLPRGTQWIEKGRAG
ncbi:MAG: O-antigen ligase family protein, partial [Vicinamibacteria bacterium]